MGYDISQTCMHGRVCTQNCFSGKIFEIDMQQFIIKILVFLYGLHVYFAREESTSLEEEHSYVQDLQ